MIDTLKQDNKTIELKNRITIIQNDFNSIQNKLLEKQANRARNKKLIEALIQENDSLERKIDGLNIDGDIDFTDIDKYSDEINSNNRKITLLQKAINKANAEIELLLITEYKDKEQALSIEYKKLFNYLSEKAMPLVFSPQVIHSINLLHKLFINSEQATNDKVCFLDYLSSYLKSQLSDVDLAELDIIGYQKAFDIPYITLFDRQERIQQLQATIAKP